MRQGPGGDCRIISFWRLAGCLIFAVLMQWHQPAHANEKTRIWKSVDEKFSVSAVLVRLEHGKAVLRRKNGKEIHVDPKLLCNADRVAITFFAQAESRRRQREQKEEAKNRQAQDAQEQQQKEQQAAQEQSRAFFDKLGYLDGKMDIRSHDIIVKEDRPYTTARGETYRAVEFANRKFINQVFFGTAFLILNPDNPESSECSGLAASVSLATAYPSIKEDFGLYIEGGTPARRMQIPLKEFLHPQAQQPGIVWAYSRGHPLGKLSEWDANELLNVFEDPKLITVGDQRAEIDEELKTIMRRMHSEVITQLKAKGYRQ